ncbi:MAG: hypothetical protein KDA25_03395 [Phycisphaerales bacterium]|nr:hypothetical protein [Phycisphaerales bacterium]
MQPRHMEAMEAATRGEWIDSLTSELSSVFPETASDPTAARKRAIRLDTTARTYGISTRRGLFRFASLAMLAGDDFHLAPPVQRALRHPSMHPEQVVEHLLGHLGPTIRSLDAESRGGQRDEA